MKEYRVFDKVTNSYSKEECWSITPSGKLYYGNAEWENGVVEFATGLKDKNKIMIYDGDIVQTTYGRWEHEKTGLTRNGVVMFCKKTASFRIKINESAVQVGFYDVNKIEIIGNIHDTPQGDNA